jgi:DNA-binding NarL/FixJ family response regulator
MKTSLSVLLVDDHALVRRGFRRMIEDEADLTVVGEASDGKQAVELTEQLEPDVVVLDYALPEMNGALAARRILAARPQTAILMLSMHAEASYVRNSFEAGARGYLLKNAADLELVDAIRQVAAGKRVVDPRLPPASPETAGKRFSLTTRELEVLHHIVAGKSNKEIAAHLDLSVNTVAVHRANIMAELGIHNTAELVVYAIQNGLVTLP